MAYATLSTRNSNGLNPNFRGMGNYARLATRNTSGLHPNFRGIGDVPTTSFVIGPGGQFSLSTVTTPTSTSLMDQVLSWMSQSTFLPGMPNSIVAVAAGVGLLAFIARGKR